MSADIVREIATQAFQDAMEILQIIEVMERQNTGRINGNLSDSGAARAALVVRNGLTARLVLLTAGAFAPNPRSDDRHLRKGIDLLQDANIRANVEKKGSTADLTKALAVFASLEADSRKSSVKYFRDKYTAHVAAPNPAAKVPTYADMFGFAKEVAQLMETFAIGAGVAPETLDDTADWRATSAQALWEPWEVHLK